jgi:hypothetical protein
MLVVRKKRRRRAKKTSGVRRMLDGGEEVHETAGPDRHQQLGVSYRHKMRFADLAKARTGF